METELSAQTTETIEEAAQLMAENFPEDDDEQLNLEDAAKAMDVSFASARLWAGEHVIPSEKIGGKRYVRRSVCEIVKELRELHGRDWRQHATWGAEAFEAEEEAQDGNEEAASDHDTHYLSDEDWARFWNLMRRAKALYDKGNSSGAADVVFAACDEFDVL